MRTPHLVPLSKQAMAILKQIKQFCGEHELIFIGDHDPRKPMSENTVNSALRVMGYDTKVEVCGHGFRTMACSSLIESGLWSKDAVDWAVVEELMTGDDNGNLLLHSHLTREQFCVMLKRYHDRYAK